MKSLSTGKIAVVVAVIVILVLTVLDRGSNGSSGDAVAVGAVPVASAGSVPASQVSRAAPQVALPISDSNVDLIVTMSQQVTAVLANPNLSADEQNSQTAALSTGNLVLDGHPAPQTQQQLDPVVVQGFEYMSPTQVQVKAGAGSLTLFLTFAKPSGQWLVDDATSNGCATGSACPFDPSPLPSLAGSDD